jgi:hypothetical protein
MPLSGTITSADPILVSTLPRNYLPIYCYIEKIYKIVTLWLHWPFLKTSPRYLIEGF